MMLAFIGTHFNYLIVVLLMMAGLYAVFSTGNLVKRLIGLGIFQTSVFLLYISLGKVRGGQPPILPETHHGPEPETAAGAAAHAVEHAHGPATEIIYSNPLPHVLILTAIVVGVATLAVGLALVVRIRESYGSIEDEDLLAAEAGRTEEAA